MLSVVALVVSVVMATLGKSDIEAPRVLGVIGCAQLCRSMCLCSKFTYNPVTSTCNIAMETKGITIPEVNRTCSCNKKQERCIKTRSNDTVSADVTTL